MLRYYAIASAIVVVALALALALAPREPPGVRPHEPGGSTATPQPGKTPTIRAQLDQRDPQALERYPHAPWALSALPECFAQRSVTRGPLAFVRGHVPRELRPVPPGTLLTVADCRLHVAPTYVVVVRDQSVLVVPPLATLSIAGARIGLFVQSGARAEFRTYDVRGTIGRSRDGAATRP